MRPLQQWLLIAGAFLISAALATGLIWRSELSDRAQARARASDLAADHAQALQRGIDLSFVRDITIDAEDRAIVSAIISMADSLGMLTIAEGVETGGQLDFLRERGCAEVQGYFFSRPLAPELFADFVHKQNIQVVDSEMPIV